jgi:hypothetical protein
MEDKNVESKKSSGEHLWGDFGSERESISWELCKLFSKIATNKPTQYGVLSERQIAVLGDHISEFKSDGTQLLDRELAKRATEFFSDHPSFDMTVGSDFLRDVAERTANFGVTITLSIGYICLHTHGSVCRCTGQCIDDQDADGHDVMKCGDDSSASTAVRTGENSDQADGAVDHSASFPLGCDEWCGCDHMCFEHRDCIYYILTVHDPQMES